METCALCGNHITGSVNDSVTLIRLNPDTDHIDNHKICTDHTTDAGKKVQGCHRKLLTPAIQRQLSTSSG